MPICDLHDLSAFLKTKDPFFVNSSVPPRDSDALAQARHEIILLNPEERKQLSTAARERIKKNFALNLIVDKYQELYQRMMP